MSQCVQRRKLFHQSCMKKQPLGGIISGKALDSQGVRQARKDEIKIIEDMGVWEKYQDLKCCQVWKVSELDVNNKQDLENPLYRID